MGCDTMRDGQECGTRKRLDAMFDRFVERNPLASSVLAVGSLDGRFVWSRSAWGRSARKAELPAVGLSIVDSSHIDRSSMIDNPFTIDSPYFIASATKLYVTAIMMQLRHEGKVDLDDPIVGLLPSGMIDRIHVLDGVDRTPQITSRQLLSHTSGLANYLEDRQHDKSVLLNGILKSGVDQAWSRADVLRINRDLSSPKFAPGVGRAHYSDTNFQLLGMIIEAITGSTFNANLRSRILEPLGLSSSGMFGNETSIPFDRVALIFNGNQPLRLPLMMASVQEDGGMYSTASDSLVFLRAFFDGTLFPASCISEMRDWNPIFFPFQYGVGLMRFRIPRFMSPFAAPPDLIGHGGASGSLTFFDAKTGLLFAGTVNQIANRSLSYKLLLQASSVAASLAASLAASGRE